VIEKTKEMPIDVTIQGKVIEQQNNSFIYNFYRMANKRMQMAATERHWTHFTSI